MLHRSRKPGYFYAQIATYTIRSKVKEESSGLQHAGVDGQGGNKGDKPFLLLHFDEEESGSQASQGKNRLKMQHWHHACCSSSCAIAAHWRETFPSDRKHHPRMKKPNKNPATVSVQQLPWKNISEGSEECQEPDGWLLAKAIALFLLSFANWRRRRRRRRISKRLFEDCSRVLHLTVVRTSSPAWSLADAQSGSSEAPRFLFTTSRCGEQ